MFLKNIVVILLGILLYVSIVSAQSDILIEEPDNLHKKATQHRGLILRCDGSESFDFIEKKSRTNLNQQEYLQISQHCEEKGYYRFAGKEPSPKIKSCFDSLNQKAEQLGLRAPKTDVYKECYTLEHNKKRDTKRAFGSNANKDAILKNHEDEFIEYLEAREQYKGIKKISDDEEDKDKARTAKTLAINSENEIAALHAKSKKARKSSNSMLEETEEERPAYTKNFKDSVKQRFIKFWQWWR